MRDREMVTLERGRFLGNKEFRYMVFDAGEQAWSLWIHGRFRCHACLGKDAHALVRRNIGFHERHHAAMVLSTQFNDFRAVSPTTGTMGPIISDRISAIAMDSDYFSHNSERTLSYIALKSIRFRSGPYI